MGQSDSTWLASLPIDMAPKQRAPGKDRVGTAKSFHVQESGHTCISCMDIWCLINLIDVLLFYLFYKHLHIFEVFEYVYAPYFLEPCLYVWAFWRHNKETGRSGSSTKGTLPFKGMHYWRRSKSHSWVIRETWRNWWNLPNVLMFVLLQHFIACIALLVLISFCLYYI